MQQTGFEVLTRGKHTHNPLPAFQEGLINHRIKRSPLGSGQRNSREYSSKFHMKSLLPSHAPFIYNIWQERDIFRIHYPFYK